MIYFHTNSPDGSCLNEVSIAQSIISQALPALSPRLNITFSPQKSSDKTRLVDSQNYPQSQLEMNKFNMDTNSPVTSSLQANLSQLEATINASRSKNANEAVTPKTDTKNKTNIGQVTVTPSKWPLKPGVLVHVNANHTLSPKNQARLQTIVNKENEVTVQEEANLGLLERNKSNDVAGDNSLRCSPKNEYSKKSGKPRRNTQNVVTGLLKNLRRKSSDSDDESGKYKKINKTNKRAVSLVNQNKSSYTLPKSRLRSLFQSETPSVIVTEGGSYVFGFHILYKSSRTSLHNILVSL